MLNNTAMFVMVSIFVLFRSALSYYQEGATENDGDFDELKNDVIDDWKSSNDNSYTSYPDSIKQILLKNNPQLFFVTSMHRRPDDMIRLSTNKRNMKNNNIKDDTQKAPGKPTLSIISPLQALQRKVAVVYNIRQKERNRGLLDNYGKRSVQSSSYVDSFSDHNGPSVLIQSDRDKLNQIACCPQYERRLYGLYRVP